MPKYEIVKKIIQYHIKTWREKTLGNHGYLTNLLPVT